ncbi:MAG: hypothetical protein CL610_16205 [Anaerolineaceae bacterium]|nr:hypothetical protein [Anaerolineaceae bacterium]
MTEAGLRFVRGEDDSFTFDTGVLKGVLRQGGRSAGLVPVTYTADGSAIASGEGLFNHYRVFTRGKRYGYGARRWPSTAQLHDNGSVEIIWPVTPERPFELRGVYRWVTPNTIDVVTVVRAEAALPVFEVFLASYYQAPFIDSQVWAARDPRGGGGEGFVKADEELGLWQAFPRDGQAASIITDGRWDLEPHPLDWTMMPNYALPLAIRRDPQTALTVIVMARPEDCFGVFTPYGEEPHYSNYLSLFGRDIAAGESASAHARLVVVANPTDEAILGMARDYLNSPD